MGTDALELLLEAKAATGLPIVSEIMAPRYCGLFEEKVDLVQIGARNMQNFDLLKEVGRLSKPVLLKRGLSNTYEEWIMSAEYIMAAGNENVILCERGVRTFETFTRNTLDLSAIPAIRRMSHLPIVVDPSHAAGMYWMVEPLAMAAVAVELVPMAYRVRSGWFFFSCSMTVRPILPPWPSMTVIFIGVSSFLLGVVWFL